MASVYTARWGIMACGSIAKTFTRDLLADPSKRQVGDVLHKVVAVASSSNVEKANAFVKETGCDASETKAYGSYEDLVGDANVEIIYIASPHAQHYENTLLALHAGKHVLCEKPFTINAKQTERLIQVAKEKNVFLMEAMWTRFFPLVLALQQKIHKERIVGKLKRVYSDFGVSFPFEAEHRLYNPSLGGGALLDLGIYPLTWLLMTLYDDPANEKQMPSQIGSTMLKVPQTGVDAQTTAGLVFETLGATGTLTTTLEVQGHWKAFHTLIQGEKGTIVVKGTPFRPESFELHLEGEKEPQVFDFPIPGQGMFWEADACARDLRDGKVQEERYTWQDSMTTMTILDTIRKQNNFTYPQTIESL